LEHPRFSNDTSSSERRRIERADEREKKDFLDSYQSLNFNQKFQKIYHYFAYRYLKEMILKIYAAAMQQL
jgi:hypothetical protein